MVAHKMAENQRQAPKVYWEIYGFCYTCNTCIAILNPFPIDNNDKNPIEIVVEHITISISAHFQEYLSTYIKWLDLYRWKLAPGRHYQQHTDIHRHDVDQLVPVITLDYLIDELAR